MSKSLGTCTARLSRGRTCGDFVALYPSVARARPEQTRLVTAGADPGQVDGWTGRYRELLHARPSVAMQAGMLLRTEQE